MKSFAFALMAALLMAAGLTSCGAPAASKDLAVFNWQDYIPDSLLTKFKTETGINLVYDTYDSNESMYTKILSGAAYDVVFPSTDFVPRMIQKDMLLKIDASKVPALADLDPSIDAKNTWDPKNNYSVPYNLGASAIVYWKDKVKVTDPSWSIFTNKAYAGKIMLMDDPREILGAGLRYNGFSANSTSADEITKAKNTVLDWKKGIVKFDNDLIKSAFAKKEIWIAFNYPENQAADLDPADLPNMGIFFPKEGGMLYIDTMVIMKNSKNVENAYKFINFILTPENLAQVYDEYGYPGVLYPKTKEYRKVAPRYTAADLVKDDVRGDVGEASKLYEAAYEEIKSQ